VEYVLIATRQPAYLDLSASSGIIMAISAASTFPVVLWMNDFTMAGVLAGNVQLIFVIILMTGIVSIGIVLTLVLTKSTGAVFASQCSYAITFFGIVWSVLLLRESISVWNWVALALMVIGLAVVGPKRGADLEHPAEILA
jgi:drug/metabolite transporter (DMT)-like permease